MRGKKKDGTLMRRACTVRGCRWSLLGGGAWAESHIQPSLGFIPQCGVAMETASVAV